MKYALVATTGHLLLVDLDSKFVIPLEKDRPEYYGISWFAGGTELVLSHSGVNNSELIDIASYAQSEKGWISKGGHSSRQFLSAPHQILCAPDGRIVCTNTGRNVVSIVDLDRPALFQEAGVSTARWDRLALDKITGDHLNSVFLRGGELFVIAHGHNKGSKLAVFSYPNLDLLSVTPLGERTGLHNIWITPEGQRISCHSETGSLIDIDCAKPLWESGSPVYTRGLAAAGNYVLVGESQKTGRDLRRSSLSALWVLDKDTWQAIDYICLGPYGAVNEVRLLDVPDQAHHGAPFQNIEKLLAESRPRDAAQLEIQAAEKNSQNSAHAYTGLTQRKLLSARAVWGGRAVWASYSLVLGSPETLDGGGKRAAVDNLCLAVKQDAGEQPQASFTYALEAGQVSHVSAILGYVGKGGDTHMAALLVQRSGGEGALSVWNHNGEAWRRLTEFATLFGLPLEGDFHLKATTSMASLSVGGVEVLRLNASDLGLERCDRGLGIRWIGATVKPLD